MTVTEAQKRATKKWRRNHPADYRKQQNSWRRLHPEKVRQYRRDYRLTHPDKVRAALKRHYQRHPFKGRTPEQKKRHNEVMRNLRARRGLADVPHQEVPFAA